MYGSLLLLDGVIAAALCSMGLTLESRESAALHSVRCERMGLADRYRRPPNGHGGPERDTSPSERCASMFDTLVINF